MTVPTGTGSLGTAPASTVPGVYAIESPVPFDEAPIDLDAVQAWIDRVHTLRLDSQPPGAEALAQRLGEFWIPSERVGYIGWPARICARACEASSGRRSVIPDLTLAAIG